MSYMRDARGSRLDSFDPLRDLPKVVAWYDFGALTGADGTAITRVPDKSGHGHDLVQATASAKPTKQTGSDGKPVARFAANQFLTCPPFGAGWPIGAAVPVPVTIVAVGVASSANTNFPQIVAGGTAGGAIKLLIDAATSHCTYLYGGTAGSAPGGPTITDDAWHTTIATADTSSGAVYIDGYLVGAAASIGTDGLKNLLIGGQGASNFLGDLRQVMVIAGRLRFDQVQQLTAWMAAQAPTPAAGLADAGANWEQTTDANGTAVRIFAPRVASTPKTLILWSHPAGQTEQMAPGTVFYNLAHAAMAQGWYFASTNQHGDTWGTTQSVTDLQAIDTLMGTRDTFTKKILVGGSMGGLPTALALSAGSVSNVVGGYFIDAVLSLAGQYGNSTYTAQIGTAYGMNSGTLSAASLAGATSISSSVSFASGTAILIDPSGTNPETVTTNGAPTGTGPYTIPVPALGFAHASGVVVSDYPAKTTGRDPLLKAASSYATRLRFIASAADASVVKAKNTDQFRTLVAATATESGLLAHTDGHLAGGGINPADFVAFVKRCIGP